MLTIKWAEPGTPPYMKTETLFAIKLDLRADGGLERWSTQGAPSKCIECKKCQKKNLPKSQYKGTDKKSKKQK
jgi:hypothetical protein